MVFAAAMVEKKEIGGGLMMEKGTFNLAGVTTGTITANTATGNPDMHEIIMWSFASAGDTAVLPARDVAPNAIKITGTQDETGTYTLIGRGA